MYTYTHLENFTQKVYENINVYKPNELNLYEIADLLNIGVYPISGNSQAIQLDSRQYIFLNNTLNRFQRFEVFGHELGHIFLHTGNQQRMIEDYRMYQEWKANLFALHFCVPTFMLQRLPADCLNKYAISEMFGVTVNFANKRLNRYHNKLMYNNSMQQSQLVMGNYRKDFQY